MNAAPLPLSGVVIAFNECDRIGPCLESLLAVCKEVIVVDSGSTDGTAELAQGMGARVVQQEWLGFGRQKNHAIAQASQPWVLLLDADEWLEPAQREKLREWFGSGDVNRADVWRLQRRTRFLGTAMRFGSFACEPVERLFRQTVRYQPVAVHEALELANLRVASIRIRIEHDTARSAAEYWAKLQKYAQLWAQERAARGRRSFPGRGLLSATAYWLKNCVALGGILDGPNAWKFHALHARYAALKYRLLRKLASR